MYLFCNCLFPYGLWFGADRCLGVPNSPAVLALIGHRWSVSVLFVVLQPLPGKQVSTPSLSPIYHQCAVNNDRMNARSSGTVMFKVP